MKSFSLFLLLAASAACTVTAAFSTTTSPFLSPSRGPSFTKLEDTRLRFSATTLNVGGDKDDPQRQPQRSQSPVPLDVSSSVTWDWKSLADSVFAQGDERPIVLFDGVCNLCNGAVNFAMDHDPTAKLRFCSLQSKVAKSLMLREGKDPTAKSEITYVTKDGAYFSSDAVSRICMELDAKPLQWFGHLGQYTPTWIREGLYMVVAKNRYEFGENDSCRMDYDGTYTSRFVSDPLDDDEDDRKEM